MTDYKVNIPEGKLGAWEVLRYSVTAQEEAMQRLRCALNPQRPTRVVPEGAYTALTRNGSIIMSDTPDEINDHIDAIDQTEEGHHCLVGGLGLGMVAQAMLDRGARVTVIELCEEVIELVGTHLKERYGDRLEIIQADMKTWRPPKGAHYDVVWLDIWDNIDMDNLEEMEEMKSHFYKCCDWIECWQEDGCRGQKERIELGQGWY